MTFQFPQNGLSVNRTVTFLGPFHTDANYSCKLFARIHTDASDQVVRQNTLTSFLTFIIDSVYRFIVFIDLVMLFWRKSYCLDLRILKRSQRSLVFTAVMSQIQRMQRKFVHDINKAKQSKAEKRRLPKPLCLSNVHNIIMKLKNGVIKIGRV